VPGRPGERAGRARGGARLRLRKGLAVSGYLADVEIAAQVGASQVVPVLRSGVFTAAVA
jgi:hypothetical protein